jgi:hypothetical protein
MRARLDGLGGWLGGAAALWLLALCGVLIWLQSPPDQLLWTGTTVPAHEVRGVVEYSWQGQNYTLDVPGFDTRTGLTVYLDPSDPTSARLNSNVQRGLSLGFTALPLLAGFGVLGLGIARRRKVRTRAAAEGFGQGLSEEFVRRRLEDIRRQP